MANRDLIKALLALQGRTIGVNPGRHGYPPQLNQPFVAPDSTDAERLFSGMEDFAKQGRGAPNVFAMNKAKAAAQRDTLIETLQKLNSNPQLLRDTVNPIQGSRPTNNPPAVDAAGVPINPPAPASPYLSNPTGIEPEGGLEDLLEGGEEEAAKAIDWVKEAKAAASFQKEMLAQGKNPHDVLELLRHSPGADPEQITRWQQLLGSSAVRDPKDIKSYIDFLHKEAKLQGRDPADIHAGFARADASGNIAKMEVAVPSAQARLAKEAADDLAKNAVNSDAASLFKNAQSWQAEKAARAGQAQLRTAAGQLMLPPGTGSGRVSIMADPVELAQDQAERQAAADAAYGAKVTAQQAEQAAFRVAAERKAAVAAGSESTWARIVRGGKTAARRVGLGTAPTGVAAGGGGGVPAAVATEAGAAGEGAAGAMGLLGKVGRVAGPVLGVVGTALLAKQVFDMLVSGDRAEEDRRTNNQLIGRDMDAQSAEESKQLYMAQGLSHFSSADDRLQMAQARATHRAMYSLSPAEQEQLQGVSLSVPPDVNEMYARLR